MINKDAALNNALNNFPRWMDIRKRNRKSQGGLYLKSIVDELVDIEQAIIDYKKEFFTINYLGKESTVIDYLYIANIGIVEDIYEIKMINPELEFTEDKKDFYLSEKALLSEGRIFLKPANILLDQNTIEYELRGYKYKPSIERIHIWNIFDEFALFSGIERYDGEINEELLKRCLSTFSHEINSSNDGIRNTIKSALINVADINVENIKIDRVNYKNAFEGLEDSNVIEHLSEINRDQYRNKEWDINRWEHPFKNTEFIPHKWDQEIGHMMDGVGYNDALKVLLSNEIEDADTTDITINGYKKTLQSISQYIRDARKEIDISLSLLKYNNILKSKKVEYKITASTAEEITDNNTYIDCFISESGESKYYIEDMILDTDGATIENPGVIQPGQYNISFRPASPYSEMKIEKLLLNGQSILEEKNEYVYNYEGSIVNSNVKLHANSTRSFNEYSNIMNLSNGVTLTNATQIGNIEINLEGMANRYIKIEHECERTSAITDASIVKFNKEEFEINEENKIISKTNAGEIIIEGLFNEIHYELEVGQTIVYKIINGEVYPNEVWNGENQETLKFDKPTNIKIVINKINNSQDMIIKNISYSRYEVNMRLENGNFINTDMGRILPQFEENKLFIEMKTFTGYSPTLNFIHIGSNIQDAVYELDFEILEESILDISTDCEINIINLTTSEEINEYSTKNIYRNDGTSSIYLKIDLGIFTRIVSSSPNIEKFLYQGELGSFIKLNPGESIKEVFINGEILHLVNRVYINDLIKESFEQVFVSKDVKGFIKKDGLIEELVKIKKIDLSSRANLFRIINIPEGIEGGFIVDNETIIISNQYNKMFEEIYLFPRDGKIYVAYNSVNMFKNESNELSIIRVFNPIIPQGSPLLTYRIDDIDGEVQAEALFLKEGENKNWSLGEKSIKVYAEIDTEDPYNYQNESLDINEKVILRNNIELKKSYLVDNQLITLDEYIVTPPEDMYISYELKISPEITIIAEEDGFNKLPNSNIRNIQSIEKSDGTIISEEDYSLLKEEGIISWNNNSLVGEYIKIIYRYDSPKYLMFKDIESLYALIEYSIEAYENIFTLNFEKISSDIILTEDQKEMINESDRNIIDSSNPIIKASIDNDIISVNKIEEGNKALVKSGYYTHEGLEYYYFINQNENKIERVQFIELFNVDRVYNSLVFKSSSKNYLPDTMMYPRRIAKVCNFDFANNDSIVGVSVIEELTACDTFGKWACFEMEIGFEEGLNSLGILFNKLDENGYAVFDITRYIDQDKEIILYSNIQNLKIAKEKKYDGMSFNNSLSFTREYDFINEGDIKKFEFNEMNYEKDTKYFILVEDEGIIDDIIIKDKAYELEEPNKKNIDKLGISIIEQSKEKELVTFLFDETKAKVHKLDIGEDDLIQVSSDIQWGLTKEYESKGNWSNINILSGILIKDSYVKTYSNPGIIETKPIYIKNKNSIKEIIIKSNSIENNNSTIEVSTSKTLSGIYRQVPAINTNNIAKVKISDVDNYIKIKVNISENHYLSEIEVYFNYIEVVGETLKVNDNNNGFIETKIYNTENQENYRICKINIDRMENAQDISIYARAFREMNNSIVWTDWREVELNSQLEVTNQVNFLGYKYFQFKIEIKDKLSKIILKSFELESL